MFGSQRFKEEVQRKFEEVDHQISELKKSEIALRSQNVKLNLMLKNLGKKLIMRLPVSIESLEKGLSYDLIFVDEIEAWRQATQGGVVLDVRPSYEFEKVHIPESINLPYDQIPSRMKALDPSKPYLLVCENGIRSVSTCEMLQGKGFSYLYVLQGGMTHYRDFVLTPAKSEVENESEEAITLEAAT